MANFYGLEKTFFLFFFNLILFLNFTILYWFYHTSTWIHHRCTRVPHPELPSHLPPHTIPLGHPSAPAPSFLYPASNLTGNSFLIWYYTCFNAILLNHPPPPSPTESKRLFYISVSLLLSRIQGYCYHLSKFHIYVLVYCIGVFLSGLLHSLSLLGIHTEETKIERDTCTPMFITALFIIARTWKQPRCPSADEWIRKLW